MNDAHFTNFNRTRCLIDIIDDNWARDTLDFEEITLPNGLNEGDDLDGKKLSEEQETWNDYSLSDLSRHT